MAATDSRPIPLKNTAYRVYFPILDADGDLVTGAASLDSEVSIDGAAFADCTNEATEIGSTGLYYLDLTASEMNGDAIIVQVKTGTSGAKTTPIILYPQEADDIRVSVTHFGGTAGTFASGRPEVNASHAAGTAWNSGAIGASTLASDTITAAKIAADAITAAKIADGAIDAATFAANAITAAKLDPDVTTELQNGLATAAALSTVDGKIDTLDTNVDTLLARITSTLFSGITSLAEWLGLMAGKQTGNTTARNELRATGAGSGTYSETTDSLEAVRDRGDAAWITATGFSTHSAADVWAAGTRTLTAGTNIVLAKGTGVTGFNDLSAAQVNSEVDTALADIHLDHLLATTYDPASKPGASDALLNELVENDGGVARYTANALEQAPTGGGGGSADWTADEKTAIRSILGIPASGTTPDDPTTGILDTIRDRAVAIEVDTQDIQSRLPAALVSGRMSSDAVAISGSTTAADNVEANIGNLDATVSSRLATAGYTAPPSAATNASAVRTELTTELGRIDAAISSRSTVTTAQVNAEADQALADVGLTTTITGRVDAAISTRATPAQVATELATYDAPTKAELDSAVDALPTASENAAAVLAAATANPIDANVQEINDVALTGDGSATPWGPA